VIVPLTGLSLQGHWTWDSYKQVAKLRFAIPCRYKRSHGKCGSYNVTDPTETLLTPVRRLT